MGEWKREGRERETEKGEEEEEEEEEEIIRGFTI